MIELTIDISERVTGIVNILRGTDSKPFTPEEIGKLFAKWIIDSYEIDDTLTAYELYKGRLHDRILDDFKDFLFDTWHINSFVDTMVSGWNYDYDRNSVRLGIEILDYPL